MSDGGRSSDGGDGGGAAQPCGVDRWLADPDGGFIDGGPDAAVASPLADHIRRVAMHGGKESDRPTTSTG